MFASRRTRFVALGAAAVTLTVCVPLAAGAAAEQHGSGKPAGERTVFYDGFDGASVNTGKWNIDVTRSTQYNNELEAYTASPDNVRIVHGREAAGADDNSALLLQAHYQPGYTTPAGNKLDFTSGKIDSAHKFDTARGTISARMKLPVGIGYWPAFWLLGYGSWPATGEIDVMENIGDPSWVSPPPTALATPATRRR
jgi:beta-glucanase (GH16 family)